MQFCVVLGLTLLLSSSSTFAQGGSTTETNLMTKTPGAISTSVNNIPSNASDASTAPDASIAPDASTASDASTALPTPTKNVDSTPLPDTSTEAPDPQCLGRRTFEPCIYPETANCTGNSQCSCKDEKHFCRCNNDNEKWYIGEDCEQEWTVVTFALVASLPGVALAAIVGVAVYICSRSGKKKSAAKVKSPKPQKAGPHNESSPEYGYANMVFASDVQNGRKPQPVRASPSHDNIPMAGPRADSAYWDHSNKNSHASAQPSRNPYNSPERYGGYRNPYAEENSTARGSQPGYQHTNPYMPTFSAPDYGGPKSQFPRAQVGRQY